jgi:purine-cytosine permease-like protein
MARQVHNKGVLAFAALLLSVIAFPLFDIFGEGFTDLLGIAGFVVMFIVMAAYFFFCQFRLSHGNTDALRKDWPIMLGLNVVPLVLAILQVDEKWPENLLGGLSVLMAGLGGAFAGAVVASRAARKRQGPQ